VESPQLAVTRQRPVNSSRGMVVPAHSIPMDCAHNSGIRDAIAKHQLRYNRGTVFYTQSMPRCYKQDKLGVPVSEVATGVQLLLATGVQLL
jgi:hypothetical protein